jgi:hypothetical protein
MPNYMRLIRYKFRSRQPFGHHTTLRDNGFMVTNSDGSMKPPIPPKKELREPRPTEITSQVADRIQQKAIERMREKAKDPKYQVPY